MPAATLQRPPLHPGNSSVLPTVESQDPRCTAWPEFAPPPPRPGALPSCDSYICGYRASRGMPTAAVRDMQRRESGCIRTDTGDSSARRPHPDTHVREARSGRPSAAHLHAPGRLLCAHQWPPPSASRCDDGRPPSPSERRKKGRKKKATVLWAPSRHRLGRMEGGGTR